MSNPIGRVFVVLLTLLACSWVPIVIAGPPHAAVGAELVTNSIGMQLAKIPKGTFVMGSEPNEVDRDPEELAHEVTITKSFLIGVYEVRQSEFERVMGSERRAVFDRSNRGSPDHPMEDVMWKEAVEFCTKLSQLPDERRAGRTYRLPTEAEWEYACRAGTRTPYHFGDSLSSRQANFNGNYPYGNAEVGPYLRMTAKVGSYPPNAWGLYDMHGNVSEWCADWYDEDFYRSSPKEDPLGPPFGVVPSDFGGFYLVMRGGSWLDDASACRSAYRLRAMPENRYRLIGFRVACDTSL